ncbi:CLUMA_CG005894, isoform A [Clunio marinus]|uniref:CLUMA_CG005894, isoform A n=1 Tax=Clunio marinus TaxID=568069 RepID=A0A1J1HXN1_9DIPT|nr:CLUMA_CG005894, isoform A [Clunio marinus]
MKIIITLGGLYGGGGCGWYGGTKHKLKSKSDVRCHMSFEIESTECIWLDILISRSCQFRDEVNNISHLSMSTLHILLFSVDSACFEFIIFFPKRKRRLSAVM